MGPKAVVTEKDLFRLRYELINGSGYARGRARCCVWQRQPRDVACCIYNTPLTGPTGMSRGNGWRTRPGGSLRVRCASPQAELLIDPSSLTRWHKRLGEAGGEA
jgi:hypothetical protein